MNKSLLRELFPILAGDAEEDVGHIDAAVVFHHAAPLGHAVAPGHFLGGDVVVADDGEDMGKLQLGKGIVPAGHGGLGGIALVPNIPAEEVSHFGHLLIFPNLLHCDTALPNHRPGLL